MSMKFTQTTTPLKSRRGIMIFPHVEGETETRAEIPNTILDKTIPSPEDLRISNMKPEFEPSNSRLIN